MSTSLEYAPCFEEEKGRASSGMAKRWDSIGESRGYARPVGASGSYATDAFRDSEQEQSGFNNCCTEHSDLKCLFVII